MKHVLITGANKSIGLETARLLAQQGYFVYLGCRDLVKGQQAVAHLAEAGLAHVEAVQLDVCDKASIQAAAKTIRAKTSVLDVLINNAGVLGAMPQNALLTGPDQIREVFDTNFFGPIEVTLAFLELLEPAPVPVIVNITSGLASLTLQSDPTWIHAPYKLAAYGPSKTALNAHTVFLAHELRAKGFKVNAVDPGQTATDFTGHQGGAVTDAAQFVVHYATIGADGPTGKYFSRDAPAGETESPW
ncbi:SDR family NAD(P)-dependent oxidoreductase [Hymenobacter wooponensis]|uniref:SDR family NAD(P)-dependent oxidoreductase n=1 Tax=Hymenobacter wooponensis TaxID=1525360 RepID=A0A4Z0MDV0_9BACT|nr:SDR family NAD(P)-dependent oxidoreductase [Hymenobacter wooponensis]TGD77674.1 SDR family NAD(P)-dependent oxidoreductase [Hymenobacter wooponensis]